jgi:hypothetical protein
LNLQNTQAETTEFECIQFEYLAPEEISLLSNATTSDEKNYRE